MRFSRCSRAVGPHVFKQLFRFELLQVPTILHSEILYTRVPLWRQGSSSVNCSKAAGVSFQARTPRLSPSLSHGTLTVLHLSGGADVGPCDPKRPHHWVPL